MEFKEQVKKGFQACKEDIETLFDENRQLSSSIENLSQENSQLKSQIGDLTQLLSSFKEEFKSIHSQLEEIKNRPASHQQTTVAQEISTQSPSVLPQTQPSIPVPAVTKSAQEPIQQDPYEALLAFKAKTNKREMLKQKMMSLVGDNGMNLSELKFMIVDHFKYCSKATFYNYLKELELERHIKIERSHSKNIVYLAHLAKEI